MPRTEVVARTSRFTFSGRPYEAPFSADSDGDGERELYSHIVDQAGPNFFRVSDMSGRPGATPPPSFIQYSEGAFPFGATDIDGDGTDDLVLEVFHQRHYTLGVGFGGPNGWLGTDKFIDSDGSLWLLDDLDHDGVREVAGWNSGLVIYDGVALLAEPDGGSLWPYEVLRLVPGVLGETLLPFRMHRGSVDVDADGRQDLVGWSSTTDGPIVVPDIEGLYAQGGTHTLSAVATMVTPSATRGLVNGPEHVEVADLDGDGNQEIIFIGSSLPAGGAVLWIWDADALVPGALDADTHLSGFALAPSVSFIDWGFATLFDRNRDGADELVLQIDGGCRPLFAAPPTVPQLAALPAWNGPIISDGGGFLVDRCAAGPDFNHDGRVDVLAYGHERGGQHRTMIGAL
jgi:hypothetical protein